MSLKEIFNKKKDVYDPVHAHVPGVNEEYRWQLIEEYVNGGDPVLKSKPEPLFEPPKKRTIINFSGIKLVRFE